MPDYTQDPDKMSALLDVGQGSNDVDALLKQQQILNYMMAKGGHRSFMGGFLPGVASGLSNFGRQKMQGQQKQRQLDALRGPPTHTLGPDDNLLGPEGAQPPPASPASAPQSAGSPDSVQAAVAQILQSKEQPMPGDGSSVQLPPGGPVLGPGSGPGQELDPTRDPLSFLRNGGDPNMLSQEQLAMLLQAQ